ncbi:DNA protecting protein DprA [Mucilaginibacter sp. PPCGB 2223]|uniref:DNA-processing protein DprA n=1 Tax=Mucilaginibacter sp. PPCGB 2223 TaxID=1886027 RepID=UPI0008264007|nr:DNA-processing protein DprA [Mucilaginibacter sp. PPCGB 2223]OCX51526.1 DNA protecting protein DprA [Mucilaginibacter sp. PPCGB 2223]
MSTLHQLALTFTKNIGDHLAKVLVSYCGSAEAVFKTPAKKLLQIPGINTRTVGQFNFDEALRRAEQELRFVEKNNIRVIFYTDTDYPKRLKNCADSPALLYYKGNADLNNARIISIVGTRTPTEYGRQLCHGLIEDLKPYDVLVVSGLAYGIDVAVHKECLNFNIPTVGVFGHGLDRVYPAQNRSVAEKMLANGGLLTDFPSGTLPAREHFPRRNRIVAGIADATVVIEANIKSGTLITAEIANSYNRDVFAFPGRVNDEFSEGCNFLIRNNKAALLTSGADLAYILGWEKVSDDKPAKAQLALPIDLPAGERIIFEAIQQNAGALGIDDLAIRTALPLSQLAMNLLNLEMQGYIRSLPGKTYSVNY